MASMLKDIVYLRHDRTFARFRRMGRPPLNMKIVPVRLPPEVVEQVDALVGTYGRARFIREAVEAELERRRVHLSAPDVAAVQT